MTKIPDSKKDIALSSYIAGFVLSLSLTITAYAFVTRYLDSYRQQFSYGFIASLVIILALTQLVVQLVFFLHLDKENKPRWNIAALLFAVMVVVILVFGSIWIMNNLDYHNASPDTLDIQMLHDEGIHR